ncbi:MAG: hypothetical protein QJR07_03550 [Acetobacteraceae bacterium]|nr:hypothetical protein [Acetobacteraceae bacterium]
MLRKVLLASVLTLGAAGIAQAQDPGPWLIGGGDNAQVVYAEPTNNVVGGAVAAISGGGENTQIAYGRLPAAHAQDSMTAELVGGGENARVVYHQATPAESMLAGQAARVGG